MAYIDKANKNTWETPQELFDELNEQYHFTLDPCALPENAKCKRYFTPDDNGLSRDWSGETVFCNPPYGRGLADWVRKAAEESKKQNTVVVMLLPVRSDAGWFHDYCIEKGKIVFLRGRLKFGGARANAPFPSMLVIFGNTSAS